jgi:C4-dicarboxylate-specific signal transduction histidine kinase
MDGPEQDKETRSAFKDIIDTVDRLERWTGSLLAYLLPLKPQAQHGQLKDIVEGALSPLQQKIKAKSIQLNLPKWPKNNAVYTDQHLLEQVIYNLLLNAIDASNKDDTIDIVVEMKRQTFSLQILDRAGGMPFKPDPSAISAPSTKRFGTGLGIPFAFKVCDALGGELNFAARPEGGTVITMQLPA